MAEGWLELPFSLSGKRIFVAGHNGMVGSAVVRRLAREDCEILTAPKSVLDLRVQAAVKDWMGTQKPDVVILAAARVGGILDNAEHPADFLYDNLMIEANVIHAAYEAGVEKLLFLGSSCIYPKEAAQPISEHALLSAALEPTNEAYAIAKIAGVKLCQAYRAQHGADFISVMPCNLYGAGDRFDAQRSHVIPALIMKAQAAKISGAKSMSVWGSGKPMREFLCVDDLADGLVFLMKNYSSGEPINVGSGSEISIADLARVIADVVGFDGELEFDVSKPDGTMRKCLDVSRMSSAGWTAEKDLRAGLAEVYEYYLSTIEQRDAA